MNKKEESFLSRSFLFKGMSEGEVYSLLSDTSAESIRCARGEKIKISQALAFVYSGECEIIRRHGEHERLVLNILKSGDSFGILSVFTEAPAPTEILAKKECSILFLSRTSLVTLTEKSPAVAMNIIRFLSDRVSFLNQRIATLASTTVSEKLASHIKEEMQKNGTCFPFQAAKVARRIGAGRASLYRALSALSGDGVLSHEEGLLRIHKPEYFDNN